MVQSLWKEWPLNESEECEHCIYKVDGIANRLLEVGLRGKAAV